MRKFISAAIGVVMAGVIVWAYSEILQTDSANAIEKASTYTGVVSEITCNYQESKHKSSYVLSYSGERELGFSIGKHKCQEEQLKQLSGKPFKATFIGGLPLEVVVGAEELLAFEKGKETHNVLYIAIAALSFVFLSLSIYHGYFRNGANAAHNK